MNNQQKEILLYLYRFRFLTRNQIQILLHHKHFNRIIIWLNELTKLGYIRRYYNSKTVTVPAVYSLGLQGRKYFKNEYQGKDIKRTVLDRIWREHKRSLQLRNHCLFLTDIYLSLVALTQQTEAKLDFRTKADLNGIQNLIFPYPDAFFSIEEKNGSKKYYFLDTFDELPARVALRKRVRHYFEYFANEDWQNHTQKLFPSVILICPDERSKNYLFRTIQNMLEDEPDLHFYLTMRKEVAEKGLTKETLVKVQAKDD